MSRVAHFQGSVAAVRGEPTPQQVMEHAARLEKQGHYLESDAKWAEYDRMTAPKEKS